MILKLFVLLAHGFGLGLIPKVPGTFGTLLGFPLAVALLSLPKPTAFIIFAFLFILALWAIKAFQNSFENKNIDDARIVIDEYLAFALLLYFLPNNSSIWFIAFIVFRFFDITKPFPINWLDSKFKNIFGVMLDDLLAALLSWILIQVGLALV